MLHSTRFGDDEGQSLSYGKLDARTWSFFHDQGDGRKLRVGPHYTTKAALLADMTRYAEEFGF